jgi:membrane dipeptidase
MQKGLKAFGKDAVAVMNDIGIIIDVSHLSDGGFWDVVYLTKRPFVASHSNCRAIAPHRRNLSDEMIRALANKGGVMGLNFYGPFLNADASGKESRIIEMLRHIKHMINVGGSELPAIGTDFDGMDGSFEIGDCSKMQLLFEAMEGEGFTIGQIEKVAYKNAERVIKEAF